MTTLNLLLHNAGFPPDPDPDYCTVASHQSLSIYFSHRASKLPRKLPRNREISSRGDFYLSEADLWRLDEPISQPSNWNYLRLLRFKVYSSCHILDIASSLFLAWSLQCMLLVDSLNRTAKSIPQAYALIASTPFLLKALSTNQKLAFLFL